MASTKRKVIKYKGVSTLEVLERANNYNKWIAEELLKHTKSPVLEIGAGIGNISSYYLSHNTTLTDIDAGLVGALKNKFGESKRVKIIKLDIESGNSKELVNTFRTVFGVNVLEHIDDDLKALKNINKKLLSGGKLLILVSAKKIAYTKLDKALGHSRRYEKKDLSEKLEKSGFEIEKIYHFNLVGLLSWVIRDKINRDYINIKPYQISIFDSIVPLLRVIESVVSVPMGISLIAVAKKN